MLSAVRFVRLCSARVWQVGILQQLHLAILIVLEPLDAALQHAWRQRDIVLAGDLQAVDDDGRRVRLALFAPAAEPAPAAVGELHLGQPLTPSLTIRRTSA